MNKGKSDSPPDTWPVETLDPPSITQAARAIGPARAFRDTLYTSRTLVMSDGSTLPVVAARVCAFGDEQHAFLLAHPDLEPLTE